jgi:hypothetical protein
MKKDIKMLDDEIPSVIGAKNQLKEVLGELASFAGEFSNLKHWADNFNNYKSQLDEPVPEVYDELFPSSIMEPDNRQLLVASFHSNVFGGMGSWNDMAFGKEQEKYEELSNTLYKTIQIGIMAAVNH